MSLIRDRIRFHLDTGLSVEGVVLRRRRGWFELGGAQVERRGEMVGVPEPVLIPRSRVVFAERVAC
jgi:hypothetical protein